MIPLLLCRLRDLRYAFYAQDVAEVILCPSLKSYHTDSTMIDGMFRLGARWIPVVSLSSLTDNSALEMGHFDVLILVKTEPQVAIRVSSVDGLKSFSWDALKPLDSPVDGGPAVAARLEVGGEPVLLLVASELLLEKEKQLLTRATELLEEREKLAESQLSRLEEAAS